MRKAVTAAALLLTACSQANDAPPPDPESLVECALAGASAFARTCTIESVPTAEGRVLTVLHPDGGFRRFKVLEGGGSVSAADGAQIASVMPREEGIEVTVGLDRYRIPARTVNHD